MIRPRRPRFLPDPDEGESTFLGDLLRSEAVGGGIVLAAAAVAVVWANSPFAHAYETFQHLRVGPFSMETWAADGALTLFFFVVGLELKRELVVGSLRRPADAAVPIVSALCGVAVPAGIFLAVNAGAPTAHGWAVPAATDIAFALAVLAVVGAGLPDSLRAFLLTLAVVDDLVVIVIIAVFYTSTLHPPALLAAGALLVVYAVLQRRRVRSSLLYLPLAVGAWWCMHESGVHATVAGVALGLLTRVLPDEREPRSPAERLEHRLAPLSAGVAVPFFALTSAGVVLGGAGVLTHPVAVGVLLGLVVGKPVGVLLGAWLVTRVSRAELGPGVSWRDLAGVAVLAGIGFTVALLVAELSYVGTTVETAKTAVLLASVVSATVAALVLRRRSRVHART